MSKIESVETLAAWSMTIAHDEPYVLAGDAIERKLRVRDAALRAEARAEAFREAAEWFGEKSTEFLLDAERYDPGLVRARGIGFSEAFMQAQAKLRALAEAAEKAFDRAMQAKP